MIVTRIGTALCLSAALGFIATACQPKSKSDSPSGPTPPHNPEIKQDPVAKAFGTGLLQAADLQPGSNVETTEARDLVDVLLGSSAPYNHDDSSQSGKNSSPASQDYEAFEKKAWQAVQLKGAKDKLEITGTLDTSSCTPISATSVQSKKDVTQISTVINCPGVDFSALTGTSSYDFSQSKHNDYEAKCNAVPSQSILSQMKGETAEKYSITTAESQGSSGPTSSTAIGSAGASATPNASLSLAAGTSVAESQIQFIYFEGKADGSPCSQKTTNGVFTREEGCIVLMRTLYLKDLTDGKPSPGGLNGKETFQRYESSGLQGSTNLNAIWFKAGMLKFTVNSWKGSISYSGDNAMPTYTATSGSQTQKGNLMVVSYAPPSDPGVPSDDNFAASASATASPSLNLASGNSLSLSGGNASDRGGMISQALHRVLINSSKVSARVHKP